MQSTTGTQNEMRSQLHLTSWLGVLILGLVALVDRDSTPMRFWLFTALFLLALFVTALRLVRVSPEEERKSGNVS